MDGATEVTVPAGLAAEIEAGIRAVPGVREVYRSGSVIGNLFRSGAEALHPPGGDSSPVSVARGDEGVAVTATLGVDSSAPGPRTLAAVGEAIDTVLRSKAVPRASITLTIAYVQAREGS